MDVRKLIKDLSFQLEHEIRNLPVKDSDKIFNGAGYSFTGPENKGKFSKRSHSLMTSLIVKSLWKLLEGKEYIVEIEPRFNYKYLEEENARFYPDIAVYKVSKEDELRNGQPLLFIDYESPNSSDARVIEKDIAPFCYFCHSMGYGVIESNPAYLILTSHRSKSYQPDDLSRVWRYGYNLAYLDNKEEKSTMLCNPYQYWHKKYSDVIATWKEEEWASAKEIYLANVMGENISVTDNKGDLL